MGMIPFEDAKKEYESFGFEVLSPRVNIKEFPKRCFVYVQKRHIKWN